MQHGDHVVSEVIQSFAGGSSAIAATAAAAGLLVARTGALIALVAATTAAGTAVVLGHMFAPFFGLWLRVTRPRPHGLPPTLNVRTYPASPRGWRRFQCIRP